MSYKFSAGVFIVAVLAAITFVSIQPDNQSQSNKEAYFKPVAALSDAHGLEVDNTDSSKLLIASHSGLHLLKDNKELFLIGSGTDDYMGFSTHPFDSQIFYTSGHSATTGNLGVQKSTDAGRTWKKISDGLGGPVDFHSMAIDQVNPRTIYGVFQGQLQKSIDEGQSWKYVDRAPQGIIQLVAGVNQNTLYAATTSGLQVSTDQADTWAPLPNAGAVIAMAVNPSDDQELLSYGQELGLAKSIDGGKSWTKMNGPFGADSVRFIAYDSINSSNIYTLTQSLSIYQTKDKGSTWSKVR